MSLDLVERLLASTKLKVTYISCIYPIIISNIKKVVKWSELYRIVSILYMIFTLHSYNGGNCGNNRKRTHIAVQTYTNCEGWGNVILIIYALMSPTTKYIHASPYVKTGQLIYNLFNNLFDNGDIYSAPPPPLVTRETS